MSRTGIVCLIATWSDGPLLARAVRSAGPFVDEVIVLDGVYRGVAAENNRRKGSPAADLAGARNAGALICEAPESAWPDEVSKRNVLLELARAFEPEARWALVLDADEQLERGEALASYLADSYANELFVSGLPRFEPDGRGWWAPSRLFRCGPGLLPRYAVRSDRLDYGAVAVDLGHRELTAAEAAAWLAGRCPFVRHRWDERPEWRQDVRLRYGRQLAELDTRRQAEHDRR